MRGDLDFTRIANGMKAVECLVKTVKLFWELEILCIDLGLPAPVYLIPQDSPSSSS